ncbi:SDR family NAD(P)-dependent oxidoreductase [Amycolatopsis nigrescens]|uniref:SDR family NAD(P)-dependent oxidoreductase n=1 Tax=Amycolatopsis nigrescens TaxID=381445 RepID=UPI0003679E99|nr:SDR family NAD(P)-dependent oxidoreductase [Amycolatopsis nigrescens]
MIEPKLVVVTGAGAGIGRATAEAFGRQGATVICADIDLAAAQRTANGLTGEAVRLDVADAEAWETFAGRVREEHGVPDVVVNNAGIGMGGGFLDHGTDDWRRIIDVNLMGVVHGCRLFGAQLAERHRERPETRGHLVNIASAAAFTPSKALPAYATTKAAVLMLSECLRAELAPHGVGVSAICPGFIATDIYASTVFTGLTAAAGRERGRLAGEFFGRWAPGPELVARRVLGAVRRNRPVVPVTPGAWAAYGLAHLFPPAMRVTARFGGEATMSRLEGLAMRLLQRRGSSNHGT